MNLFIYKKKKYNLQKNTETQYMWIYDIWLNLGKFSFYYTQYFTINRILILKYHFFRL